MPFYFKFLKSRYNVSQIFYFINESRQTLNRLHREFLISYINRKREEERKRKKKKERKKAETKGKKEKELDMCKARLAQLVSDSN